MIKHTLSFYIAPKIENEILQSIDDKNKIICTIEEVSGLPIKEVTEEYIRQGMKRARQAYEERKTDFWIAAVGYMDNLFKEKEDCIIFVNDTIEKFEVKND